MPIEKNSGEGKLNCCSNKFGHCDCHGFGKKLMLTLAGILLVYIIVLVGTFIRNNLQKYNYIGQADKMERTIMVEGIGKVTAKPDIAMTSMGMISKGKTVVEAQKKNTEVMNTLIAKVKALGVEEKDIQTANYNIYPQYEYLDNGTSVLSGYEVQQSVNIKIRNLEKADQVLSLAGEVGANNVSGLQFTIDDNEVYKAEAREKALQQVSEKAKTLSKSLGVKIVSIISYNEYNNNGGVYPSYYGMGGSDVAKEAMPAPTIETGSMDVVMNVNVTFEIR